MQNSYIATERDIQEVYNIYYYYSFSSSSSTLFSFFPYHLILQPTSTCPLSHIAQQSIRKHLLIANLDGKNLSNYSDSLTYQQANTFFLLLPIPPRTIGYFFLSNNNHLRTDCLQTPLLRHFLFSLLLLLLQQQLQHHYRLINQQHHQHKHKHHYHHH